MYKITVKTLKSGGLQVDKDIKHANGIETLTAIDSIICDIEEILDIPYRKVIKLIKETRKNVITKEVINNDNIDNTNE